MKTKTTFLQSFCLSILTGIFLLISTDAHAACPINPMGTYIEAEHYTGSYNLKSGTPNANDEFATETVWGANGGEVLVSGSSGAAGTTPRNEVKEYEVSFPEAGTYQIWMRGEGYSGSQDSMFFTVNNNAWKAWNFGGTYNQYIWTSGMQVGSGNTIYIPSPGEHTIKIAMRESNTRIDGFFITNAGVIPTDCLVPSGVSRINPQDDCDGIFWAVSPQSLSPTCFVGYNAASMSFTLSNIGNEDDDTEPTVISNQTWAVVATDDDFDLDAGESETVTVNFNTASLQPGTHHALITISGSASNSPLVIPVNLLVKETPATAACGEIPLYAQDLINPAIMVQLDTSGSMSEMMTIALTEEQVTPNLKDIVKKIVDRSGWTSGNSMAFTISGSGTRRIWTYDGKPADAPKLSITYTDSNGHPVTIQRSILSSDNDVQLTGTTLDREATFIDLGSNTTGLRFTDINIPQGVAITNAYLSFSVFQGNSGSTNFTIHGIDSDNAPVFTAGSPTQTTANTSWSPGSWLTSMSRIDIAEDVLKEVFLDRSISWGFSTWAGGHCRANDGDDAPYFYSNYRIGSNSHDQIHQDGLQAKADDGYPSGCTPLAPSLRGGLEYFKGNRTDGFYNRNFVKIDCQPRILVTISDGMGNTGTTNDKIDAVVDDLITEGISVVAVGFGLTNATQLQRIVDKMKTAGEASDDDYLYDLHNNAVPFMAQNRQEFIEAMNDIVSNVKAQVFRGSTPAPTTSADNGDILLTASFDASDWSGDLTARQFNPYTGVLEATATWTAKAQFANNSINAFIYDATATNSVSIYTDASLLNDNFLCKPLGDIINSTPVIVAKPPFFYDFDSYLINFKYDVDVRGREPLVYVGANDGALHAFRLSDGVEKWRFYPDSVKAKLNESGNSPQDDICSPAYCHKFILDGSPRPADIFTKTGEDEKWRTVLVTGLGRGGSSFFALDITYGEDFDEPDKSDGTEVATRFLWEFTDSDDSELGLATSRPVTVRLLDANNSTKWATLFGSGGRETPHLQANKEAYLFAVNSWDKSAVWKDSATEPADTFKVKLSTTALKNDIPASPLVIDYNDDHKMDRVYLGNMYGNMYRIKNINVGDTPASEMLYDSGKTDHSTPVTAMAEFAYAGDDDVWIYFGTGRYQDQIDKVTTDQQYFLGLFDENASTGFVTSRDHYTQEPTQHRPYKKADLVEATAEIIEAYALNSDGTHADLNNDGSVTPADRRRYRTITCAPNTGNCNPNNSSWLLNLAQPGNSGSERVITKPLVVGGIVFFATFIPDGDVCGGGGETWLFAVDWRTGEFVTDAVFDINQDGHFTDADKEVEGNIGVAGIFIGGGRPSQELAIHNNILFVGTTGDDTGVQPPGIPFQRAERAALRAWQQP